MRTTARDVADHVGCSVSAVSLVVNDRDAGRIRPALRDEILRVAALLDYRPNVTASELAKGLPSAVALVCPDIRNPFFGDLLHGLAEALHGRFNVELRVGLTGLDYDLDIVRAAQAANIGGLVLANPSNDVLEGFRPTCATVLIDSPGSDSGIVRVDLGVDQAAGDLAAHLLGLGHRRVGYVDLRRSKDTFIARRSALDAALRNGGGEITAAVEASEITVGAGIEVFRASWPSWYERGVTAIVCADDVLAYGVIGGARAAGLAIPAMFSLASFNDLPFSALLDPPLTSVHFGADEVGRVAGRTLLDLIAGGEPPSTVMSSDLQVRSSTGPRPEPARRPRRG